MSAGNATLPPWRLGEFDLLEELRLRGWARLLFIECGDGWVAEEAWRRMAKGYVCGVDRSSKLVARAERFRGAPGKLEFRTWDGRHVPYPDASFDSVVLRCDAGGCPDPAGVLREMCRVARAGGDVFLVAARDSSEWPRLLEQAGLVMQRARSPTTLRARRTA